jgi:hypothetical protein
MSHILLLVLIHVRFAINVFFLSRSLALLTVAQDRIYHQNMIHVIGTRLTDLVNNIM